MYPSSFIYDCHLICGDIYIESLLVFGHQEEITTNDADKLLSKILLIKTSLNLFIIIV